MHTNINRAWLRRVGAFASSFLLLAVALCTPVFASEAPSTDAGQTRTLLPDGRWLLVGGKTNAAAIVTKASGAALNAKLIYPRSSHTATVLPDGSVLILGGVDAAGATVVPAEIFDPVTGETTVIQDSGLTPRSQHTATLLTDGFVLVAGGVSAAGNVLQEAELWNADTQRVEPLSKAMLVPRASHSAALLADGKGLIWGGQDEAGRALVNGETYDPATSVFNEAGPNDTSLPAASLRDVPPAMEASIPQANATDAPVDSRIAIRFNKHLQVTSATAQSVTVVGPAGAITGKVIAAADGLLVFFTPQADLLPNATYTVFLRGLLDSHGHDLPWSAFKFRTRSLTAPSTSGSGGGSITIDTSTSVNTAVTTQADPKRTDAAKERDDRKRADEEKQKPQADDDFEDWIPGDHHRHGQWRVLGTRNEPRTSKALLRSVPLRAAMKQATAVSGRVVRLNGLPIQGVTVRAGNVSTLTDEQGRFILAGLRAGAQQITVDGSAVISEGRRYASHFIRVEVAGKSTTELAEPIHLARLNPANDISIPSPADRDLVLTHPDIPGLELHIPKGAVLRSRDGRVLTKLNITPLPVDRVPFAVPEGFPVYFTIQPAGAFVDGSATGSAAGVRVIYPNYLNAPAGTRMTFWNYDPSGLGWQVYGRGTVSENGQQVVPDPEVSQRDFMAFGYGFDNADSVNEGPAPGSECQAGDPVDCSTGLFVHRATDLFVSDTIPLVMARTYRPKDPRSRDFGIGTNHSYGMFLSNPTPQNSSPPIVNLILPDGGRVSFGLVSGSGLSNAVYQHNSSPTSWMSATLRINAPADVWEITTRDKTVYSFSAHSPNVLTSIRDRYGNTVSIRRVTEGGNISQVRSPNGRVLNFEYDGGKRITRIRDSAGRAVKYEYDVQGRLWRVTFPDNRVERYEYDTQHRMTKVIDRRGHTMLINEYDANSRVSKQTLADGSFWGFDYTLDGRGKVARTNITNPRGYVTQVSFNERGYVTQTIEALGQPEQQTYAFVRDDNTNHRLSIVDPLNRRTRFDLNYRGMITRVTKLDGTPDAISASFEYDDAFSQLTRYTDPLNHQTTLNYDANGSLIAVTNALSHTLGATYDSAGRLESLTNAIGKTSSIGYEAGDVATITDPLGRTTSLFTDAIGRRMGTQDGAGRHSVERDAIGRILKSVNARGETASMTYDENGNLLTVRDPRDLSSHVFTYDERNRLVTYTDPLGKTETYGYDDNGNVTSRIDRKGQTTTYAYDALDRIRSVTYADGASLVIVWDAGDRPRQLIDNVNGTIALDYDDLNRLTRELSPQGQVEYQYDDAGRRTLMTVAGFAPVSYSYDDVNQLARVEQNGRAVDFTYDAAGRRATITAPNGIVATFDFDDANQLLSLAYDLGTTRIGDVSYVYDAGGRRIGQGGSLAKLLSPPTVTSSAYDAANRLTNWGSNTLTYDDNGNVTSIGSTTYTWNARDQLVASSDGAASFGYDALKRRRSRTVSGTTTGYTHDGSNPVVVDGDFLLSGFGFDEVYAQISASGSTSYVKDGLGSARLLTDDNGATTASYSYGPYGQTAKTGSDDAALQFTGRENDGATGLYYFRARYYSPALQRFLSEDPAGFAGGLNVYAYVGGDPIGFTDPTGELPVPIITGGIGAATATLGYIAGRMAHGCDINLGDLALAFGAGFVQGAISPYLGVFGNTMLGGGINAAQDFIGNGGNVTKRELAGSFLLGVAGTLIGGVGKPKTPYPFDHSTKAPRQWVNESNLRRNVDVGAKSFLREFGGDYFESGTQVEGAKDPPPPCGCN